MKQIASLLFSIIGLFIGYGLFMSQHNSDEQKRDLASVKMQFDLSCLKDSDLDSAIKKRILSGLKTARKDGLLGFELGHYIYSPKGQDKSIDCVNKVSRDVSSYTTDQKTRRLACADYPKMKIAFTAEDSSENGEKRRFEVETECKISEDISKTEMIWIPWEKIAKEMPFEGEAQFNTPTKVAIRTVHVTQTWPKQWNLESIQLIGDSGTVTVDQQDIRTIAGHPVVFDFP